LHLIEREELEITRLSVAQITDQFLEYVAGMQERSADELADFLVMAARLIWIKSLALLPSPPRSPTEEDEEDPAEQLARQLREYKRFRDVAAWLGTLEASGARAYARVAPLPTGPRRLAPGEVKWGAVLQALAEVLTAADEPQAVDAMVSPVVVTVAEQVSKILRATRRNSTVSFRHLLSKAATRVEIVVTLLALLELIKRGSIQVRQVALFGEISISSNGPGELVSATAAA
jgi:segregation and condensation protein A